MPEPGPLRGLLRAYRATGADPPFGHPERAHGVAFEGYYWRIVDPAGGRVVVALCAVCRDARGTWGIATLAAHPGGFARTVVAEHARAEPGRFGARAGDAFAGGADALAVDLGADARLDVALTDHVAWPRRPFG